VTHKLWLRRCLEYMTIPVVCGTWALSSISYHVDGRSPTDEFESATTVPPAAESLRTELTQLQERTGLTLAAYNGGLYIVSFKLRSVLHGKALAYFGGLGGVSPDGVEIAVSEGALTIIRYDGSARREYVDVSPIDVCWSHDQSKLAITAFYRAPNARLEILDLNSKLTHVVLPLVIARSHFTSQCWSPDDKELVYEADGNVSVYKTGEDRSRVLARGTTPTWSPDGNWIAFYDHDAYFAVRPSGEGQKKLFHKKKAVSGLYWSPDSRFEAYVSQADFFEQFPIIDVEVYMLRVRRLEDGSELTFDGMSGGRNYQWVANPDLLKQVATQATK